MMHESETFEWNDVAPQLLFPIDYTSKEGNLHEIRGGSEIMC